MVVTKSLLEKAGKTEEFDAGQMINRITSVQGVQANVDFDLLTSTIAAKFEDLFINCTFQGKECNKSDFQLFVHPSLMFCYTFIGARQSDSTDNYGPQSGLSIIMKGQDGKVFPVYDRYSNTGNVKGLVVSIDEPQTPPKLLHGHKEIMPGTSTSFALSQRMFEGLNKTLFKMCREKTHHNVRKRVFFHSVSQRCSFELIRNICGCFTTETDIYIVDEAIKSCAKAYPNNITNTIEKVLCEQRIKHTKRLPENGCNCPWNCQEIKYSVDRSVS